MKRIIERAIQNPKTSIVGLAKLVGAIWFIYLNRAHITPDQLMQPENFVALGVIGSALSDFLSADARDKIKVTEVTSETTLVGDKEGE